jgi:hypothetical protein
MVADAVRRTGRRRGSLCLRGQGDRWVWLTTTVGFDFLAGVDMPAARDDAACNYRSILDRSRFLNPDKLIIRELADS